MVVVLISSQKLTVRSFCYSVLIFGLHEKVKGNSKILEKNNMLIEEIKQH